MGGGGGLAFKVCFCVLLGCKGRRGTAARRRRPGLRLVKVQVEVGASPRRPHAFLLVLFRCQSLHILIPEAERRRNALSERALEASAAPFLLPQLITSGSRMRRQGMQRRKDGESRTDEESWASASRSESVKTCSRGLVQRASFRPSLLRSASPFSLLPYQTSTVSWKQPEQRFVALNQPPLSLSPPLFFSFSDPSSFPPCHECVALLFRVH